MASTGGNLLQRTRCQYFYDTGTPCNKREPGSGCPARSGLNRNHAILGASEHCVAVHPSDLCVALAALGLRYWCAAALASGGSLSPTSIACRRTRPSATTAWPSTNWSPPSSCQPRFARHCHYLKVRDRASYAFALVSVAAALEPDGERIGELRLALGGVAHKPWRVAELEERFRGHPANRDSYVRFAEALLRDARPLAHNAFKIGLARNAIVRALEEAHSGGIGQ